MSKILITGGTTFVSKYVAQYYVNMGDEVYVFNRGNHKQIPGTILIKGDRLQIGDRLKGYNFDVILDITAYKKEDVKCLVEALDSINDYILLSSSAVYPDTSQHPITEGQKVGSNIYWGSYGVNKFQAEQYLLKYVPQAYVLRPPYLYGPMNNVYREAFAFECADKNRPFFVPRDGSMHLQFFYINDLCKFIDVILQKHPEDHIFNLGNDEVITITDWVTMCYQVAGKEVKLINIESDYNQRDYFSFYDYEYKLNVSKQNNWLKETKPLMEGILESYIWYREHFNEVNRKPYIEFIDEDLIEFWKLEVGAD